MVVFIGIFLSSIDINITSAQKSFEITDII